MTVVAACQIPAHVDHPDPTIMAAAVRAAAVAGARLIVLPELAVSGYCFDSPAEAHAAAEPLDGPTVTLLRDLSVELDCVIVSGLCEKGDGGQVFNSAVVVEGGRLIDRYRKVHLWGRETEFFTPGHQRPRVVSTAAGRIAVMICYDLEFPEWVRLAAEAGAEMITAPVNWPLLERPDSERPIEVIKAQALAAVYKIPIVIADRCGAERGQQWIGGSVICDLTGYVLAGDVSPPAEPAAPTMVIARIDPAATRDKSLGDHNDAFGDRRPALY